MANTEQRAQASASQGFFVGAPETLRTVYEFGAEAQEAKDTMNQELKEIKGITFFWNRNNYRWEALRIPVPEDEPAPDPLKLFTLDGVIEYVRENVEGLIPEKEAGERLILHVVDEKNVVLLGKPSAHRKERPTIVSCEAHVPNIVFGRHVDVDEFNTMLQSKFIETEARDELFKVLKSLTNEQSMQVAEDGVSQVITVKQGVSLASNCQFKNPVPLAPMRTFSEIEQPESNFVLRVDRDANIALFEADGGAWKNAAVARIKDYLKWRLSDCPVVVIA